MFENNEDIFIQEFNSLKCFQYDSKIIFAFTSDWTSAFISLAIHVTYLIIYFKFLIQLVILRLTLIICVGILKRAIFLDDSYLKYLHFSFF